MAGIIGSEELRQRLARLERAAAELRDELGEDGLDTKARGVLEGAERELRALRRALEAGDWQGRTVAPYATGLEG